MLLRIEDQCVGATNQELVHPPGDPTQPGVGSEQLFVVTQRVVHRHHRISNEATTPDGSQHNRKWLREESKDEHLSAAHWMNGAEQYLQRDANHPQGKRESPHEPSPVAACGQDFDLGEVLQGPYESLVPGVRRFSTGCVDYPDRARAAIRSTVRFCLDQHIPLSARDTADINRTARVDADWMAHQWRRVCKGNDSATLCTGIA